MLQRVVPIVFEFRQATCVSKTQKPSFTLPIPLPGTGHSFSFQVPALSSWSGLKSVMSGTSKTWDGELVRRWRQSRFEAARLDQAAADKRGYEAQDDYDKAAAEEWVCRTLKAAGRTDD